MRVRWSKRLRSGRDWGNNDRVGGGPLIEAKRREEKEVEVEGGSGSGPVGETVCLDMK